MLRPWLPGAHRKALALLVLVIQGGSVGAEEPERIFLRFEVFGGPTAGLHFLTLTATVDQSHQGYVIAAEAKTRGSPMFSSPSTAGSMCAGGFPTARCCRRQCRPRRTGAASTSTPASTMAWTAR